MMQYQLCSYPEIKYDPIADAILIRIATWDYGESDTLDGNEDVIFNFDTDWNILSLEIISATRHKDIISNLIFNNSIYFISIYSFR